MKKALENLNQSQIEELAVLGTVSTEFAHLLTTNSAGLVGAFELAEAAYERGDKESLVRCLQSGIERLVMAGNISGSLYSMLANGATTGKTLVNKEIMAVIAYLKPVLGYYGTEASTSLVEGLPPAGIFPDAYQLCLVNVFSASGTFKGSENVCVSTGYDEGKVITTIKDKERLIRPEIMERITNPYAMNGSCCESLWLGSTESIMDLVGGELIIESEQGEGTSVIMKIPEYKADKSEQE